MNKLPFYELNLDGLVGPTHHYSGLAPGNIASTINALTMANPQAAALQGLAKMRFLHQAGLKQAILPPQQRPNLSLLYQLGFTGSPAQQISKAARQAPVLLSACFSASSMWAANAATVSASLDSSDDRVHFTAANLMSNLHRQQEADFSKAMLERIFYNEQFFAHHPVLPRSLVTGDEGAANHSRLCAHHGSKGLNLFVYGRPGIIDYKQQPTTLFPKKYPARQTLEASTAIARSHQLDPSKVIFAQQRPEVIDEGVFHNDVIAVANETFLFIHEKAWVDQPCILNTLRKKADFELQVVEVSQEQVSVADAVSSYLFNSQILTMPDASMMLLAPAECESNTRVRAYLEDLKADHSNPIHHLHFFDLKQSMRNGGGPACLRLRVPLSQKELNAMHQDLLVSDELLKHLEQWIMKHYRTQLHADDLMDPSLIDESCTALDELTQLLNLGSIYPFQQVI